MFVWLDLLCSNLHTGMGPKDLGHLQEAIIASKQVGCSLVGAVPVAHSSESCRLLRQLPVILCMPGLVHERLAICNRLHPAPAKGVRDLDSLAL